MTINKPLTKNVEYGASTPYESYVPDHYLIRGGMNGTFRLASGRTISVYRYVNGDAIQVGEHDTMNKEELLEYAHILCVVAERNL